jgi:hypothetical protein
VVDSVLWGISALLPKTASIFGETSVFGEGAKDNTRGACASLLGAMNLMSNSQSLGFSHGNLAQFLTAVGNL